MKIFQVNTFNGSQKLLTIDLASLLATTTLAACTSPFSSNSSQANNASSSIHKIKHVVVIMQENRSFDSYFGTYPGANGIPMQNGVPTVCVPDPQTNQCVKPYHDPNDRNGGGPHGQANDRKSTRLNSSHTVISYAVFCLKKKKKERKQ